MIPAGFAISDIFNKALETCPLLASVCSSSASHSYQTELKTLDYHLSLFHSIRCFSLKSSANVLFLAN
jgi:hypothetical protein